MGPSGSGKPLLRAVLTELERSAPLRLAESWDNVGVLVNPHDSEDVPCGSVLLTVDLNGAVVDEARRAAVDLIVAYHPVIFRGVQRLRRSVPAERVVIDVLREGWVVYSPHTALDAVAGGMTDWLVSALGPGSLRAIVPAAPQGAVMEAFQESQPAEGQGRWVALDAPLSLDAAVGRIKAHLGLSQVRVARAARHQEGEPIRTWAACPGAGGSVFEKLGGVDLLLTGEMRHHDVLARSAQGTSVILCDHTNTERGYLPLYAERLRHAVPGLEVVVSEADCDPLEIS